MTTNFGAIAQVRSKDFSPYFLGSRLWCAGLTTIIPQGFALMTQSLMLYRVPTDLEALMQISGGILTQD